MSAQDSSYIMSIISALDSTKFKPFGAKILSFVDSETCA